MRVYDGFFFFKQKTAYEMRISDWSSDVCSSDLSIMHATARDYARFGEFLRRTGEAQGRQILSARWVDFMRESSPLDPGYGGHIWLNKERSADAKQVLFPGRGPSRTEEHTYELQSLMRISYAVF